MLAGAGSQQRAGPVINTIPARPHSRLGSGPRHVRNQASGKVQGLFVQGR